MQSEAVRRNTPDCAGISKLEKEAIFRLGHHRRLRHPQSAEANALAACGRMFSSDTFVARYQY